MKNSRDFMRNVFHRTCEKHMTRGWLKSLSRIRTPIRIRSCRVFMRLEARKRQPKPRRLPPAKYRKPGRPEMFPAEYLGNTVLFATVLFFANASGKFEQRRVRIAAFIFARQLSRLPSGAWQYFLAKIT